MEEKGLTPTRAMQIFCTVKSLDSAWAELIEARMAELVKPNLDKIRLLPLGEHQLLWGNHGKKFKLYVGCDELPARDERCRKDLSTQGVFATFSYPGPEKGQARIEAWGFNRQGSWLHLDLLADKRPTNSDWVERIVEVTLRDISLKELLKIMERRLAANDLSDAYRFIDNRPVVIWDRLGNLVKEWHVETTAGFERSKHFADLVRAEDLTFAAKLM